MSKARSLFDDLNANTGLTVGAYEHGSNIFPMTLPPGVELERFANRLAEFRVFVNAGEEDQSLAARYREYDHTQAEQRRDRERIQDCARQWLTRTL